MASRVKQTFPLFIAEIGLNHNGEFERAVALIEAAKTAGATCVKFQIRNLEVLYGKDGRVVNDIGAQYVYRTLEAFQLSFADTRELLFVAKDFGLITMASFFEPDSLLRVSELPLDYVKIPSSALHNVQLIRDFDSVDLPIVMSTGMSTEGEVLQALRLLSGHQTTGNLALLHCVSTYPAPVHELNFQYLQRLRELTGCVVGYSGHERGWYPSLAAFAMGARIIERHLTLDRNLEGPDHRASLLPEEFAAMTSAIKEIIPAVESPPAKALLQGEALNRISLGTSLVAAKDLNVGTVLKREHFEIRSPGGGLEPFRMESVVGTTLQQSMRKGEPFSPHLYDESDEKIVKVDFALPWGIPVRFHDAMSLLGRVPSARVVELHLGREDLSLSLKESMQDFDLSHYRLVVHSPDIFWNDHLLDLANEDSAYRQTSIRLLQSVIDQTEEWSKLFDTQELPLVVASLGGFSKNHHFDQDSVTRGYEHLSHAIKELQLGQVELLAQTLPPLPWYFGGQYFCNLFVRPDDTTYFASQENLKLCLDVSHTKMASNFYGFDFLTGVKQFLPFTRHCHVADARGSAGEGVQIGEGEIDFTELSDAILESQVAVSFVPEIWQGHLSGGGGLAEGLRRLAKLGFLQV